MVRLTENDLHKIVKESVIRTLAEINFKRPGNERTIYNMRREMLASLGIPMEVLEKLSNKMIDGLLSELEEYIKQFK
jgi:hypothetical protein